MTPYYEANRERLLNNQKVYYSRNAEKIKTYQRERQRRILGIKSGERKNRPPVTKLAIGQYIFIEGKTPGEISQERAAAARYGIKIRAERVDGGSRIIRVQ